MLYFISQHKADLVLSKGGEQKWNYFLRIEIKQNFKYTRSYFLENTAVELNCMMSSGWG